MRILITGGAGFIGSNLARRLLGRGHEVAVYDNLSRPRTAHNLSWLRECAAELPGELAFTQADVRDAEAIAAAARDVDAIFHLASQVAVTTSVQDPRNDFEINALGSFNVLEAARLSPRRPALLYASTNKVYGGMEDLVIVEEATRHRYRDLPHGVPETQPLDFHSPYGCSKGAGDQYVRDYHRIYGLPTVVFRQSAIYGPRQFGVEDQGWAAHFVIAAQTGRPISIYGDGKQVRDMLYIDDLIDLYELALARLDLTAGKIYNVGGGPANTLSIWAEFQPLLSRLAGQPVEAARFGDWRPGDQPVCVLDIRKAERELGWRPKVGLEEGMGRLWSWVRENLELFQH
jgi:CDP-paratose 2-epimerase